MDEEFLLFLGANPASESVAGQPQAQQDLLCCTPGTGSVTSRDCPLCNHTTGDVKAVFKAGWQDFGGDDTLSKEEQLLRERKRQVALKP